MHDWRRYLGRVEAIGHRTSRPWPANANNVGSVDRRDVIDRSDLANAAPGEATVVDHRVVEDANDAVGARRCIARLDRL
jgi:hypothetical protein